MDNDAYKLFFGIGTCHRLMKEHANEIRARSVVRTVIHWSDMSNLDDGFRLEEDVDAELVDGQAISWCLELTLTLEGVAVEADVRRIHGNGQDVLVEIADSVYPTVTEGSTGILEITRRLCSINPV
jgi:hypothetical protein